MVNQFNLFKTDNMKLVWLTCVLINRIQNIYYDIN